MPATNQPVSRNAEQKTDADLPLVHRFQTSPSVMDALDAYAGLMHRLLLESSRATASPDGKALGRYSFLVADPFDWIEMQPGCDSCFDKISDVLQQFQSESSPSLPPFTGGVAGLLSYDLNRSLEKVTPPRFDEFQLPAVALGAYDVVLAWDHQTGEAILISQGFPETEPSKRRARAEQRLSQFLTHLDSGSAPQANRRQETTAKAVPIAAPNHSLEEFPGLTSNFSKSQYLATVQKAIDYIYAGDVFQINLAQRLLFPASQEPEDVYRALRVCNPAPFSGFFDVGSFQIMSASPERLVSVRDRKVESRPIKGTRRRTRHPEIDLAIERDLQTSEKDRAENVMIVDLMRNDLSRVCDDDSISVPQLCELEAYESVLHLVSSVEGRLREETNLVDLLKAIFPGGSITGAPKVRAMELINELEQTARGAYCGSLGYMGFDGSMDLNILIRTITASGGYWQIPVGGGIVSQSIPEREYEETWTKAASMLAAIKASDAT